MELLVRLAADGFAVGSLYALIAIGFTLILRVTGVFHIAHAATVSLAALVFDSLFAWNGIAASAAAIAAAVIYGWISYELLYRPMKKRTNSFFPLFAVAFGLWIATKAILALIFGVDYHHPESSLNQTMNVFGINLIKSNVLGLGVAAVAVVALSYVLNRTRIGRSMRAIACNRELADAWGLQKVRGERFTFILASAMAAPAGIFLAFVIGAFPEVGDLPFLMGAAATIIGGVGSIVGAALGGLSFGVIQGVATWKFPQNWQDGVVFAVFLIVIMVKPKGLFNVGTGSGRLWPRWLSRTAQPAPEETARQEESVR